MDLTILKLMLVSVKLILRQDKRHTDVCLFYYVCYNKFRCNNMKVELDNFIIESFSSTNYLQSSSFKFLINEEYTEKSNVIKVLYQ